MFLDRNFSEQTKALIALSRSIAIDLGYDYISTLHFLLADCNMNDKFSIKNFAFKTNEDFEEFFAKQKIDETSILAETLPLTVKAEQTISRGCTLWSNSQYKEEEICPYHFFLAASQLSNTLFYSLFENKRLCKDLENYYLEIGQIEQKNIYKPFW